MNQLNDTERGRLRNYAVGFVYQFHHLLPEFTALENVAMPLLVRRMSPAEAKRQAPELPDAGDARDWPVDPWAAELRASSNGAFQINLWIPDPPPRRDAIQALYLFCREVRDVADGNASRTLKLANGLTIWNVRAMPRWQTSCVGTSAMRLPP